jgi:hypothetical protein
MVSEGCSKSFDYRKQAKLQWLQDPSEINRETLNNVRPKASIHFTNRKRETFSFIRKKLNSVA